MKRIISDEKRNQIYAGVLCALMFFWTIASVLGLIAFFRGKEESSAFNVVGASADAPADLIDTVPGANYFNVSAISSSSIDWWWNSIAKTFSFKGTGSTSHFLGAIISNSGYYSLCSYLTPGETYTISCTVSPAIDVSFSFGPSGTKISNNTSFIFPDSAHLNQFVIWGDFQNGTTYKIDSLRINKGTVAYPFSYYFYFDADEIYDLGYQAGIANAGDPEGGYDEGYQAGYGVGFTQGKNEGYNEGFDVGHDQGYDNGVESGYQAGYTEGETAGREEGYQSGYAEGNQIGYDDGYDIGHGEGYESGYTVGETVGREEGYQSGYTDGETVGRVDGYTDGYDNGYSFGLETSVLGFFADSTCTIEFGYWNGNPVSLVGDADDFLACTINNGVSLKLLRDYLVEKYGPDHPDNPPFDELSPSFVIVFGNPILLSQFHLIGGGSDDLFLGINSSFVRGGQLTYDIQWNKREDGMWSGDIVVDYPLSTTINTLTISISTAVVNYDGYLLDSSDGYNNGYDVGYSKGQSKGEEIGFSQGHNAGYKEGYDVGKIDGIEIANDYSFIGLLSAVVDVPVRTFTSLFDFNFLGINLAQFFLSLLSVCFVLVVVKLII